MKKMIDKKIEEYKQKLIEWSRESVFKYLWNLGSKKCQNKNKTSYFKNIKMKTWRDMSKTSGNNLGTTDRRNYDIFLYFYIF